MTNPDTRVSLVDELASTTAGKLELAAGTGAHRAMALLSQAKEASGLSNGALAERMGVSPGRASQIFGGDGNLRVATIARALRACGFQLGFVAEPVEEKRPAIRAQKRRSRVVESSKRTFHFEQTYITSEGVRVEINRVETAADVECPVPVGLPSRVAVKPRVHHVASAGLAAALSENVNIMSDWIRLSKIAAAVEEDLLDDSLA